jgi:hypothetical protein
MVTAISTIHGCGDSRVGVGIVPDIILEPSVEDSNAGSDVVLDRALELASGVSGED